MCLTLITFSEQVLASAWDVGDIKYLQNKNKKRSHTQSSRPMKRICQRAAAFSGWPPAFSAGERSSHNRYGHAKLSFAILHGKGPEAADQSAKKWVNRNDELIKQTNRQWKAQFFIRVGPESKTLAQNKNKTSKIDRWTYKSYAFTSKHVFCFCFFYAKSVSAVIQKRACLI